MNRKVTGRVLSESCLVPNVGTIHKSGNKTTFTMQLTFSTTGIDSMQNAKAFFNLHQKRMERILSRYCDLVATAASKKDSELFTGGAIVKRVMSRLGFIDEG